MDKPSGDYFDKPDAKESSSSYVPSSSKDSISKDIAVDPNPKVLNFGGGFKNLINNSSNSSSAPRNQIDLSAKASIPVVSGEIKNTGIEIPENKNVPQFSKKISGDSRDSMSSLDSKPSIKHDPKDRFTFVLQPPPNKIPIIVTKMLPSMKYEEEGHSPASASSSLSSSLDIKSNHSNKDPVKSAPILMNIKNPPPEISSLPKTNIASEVAYPLTSSKYPQPPTEKLEFASKIPEIKAKPEDISEEDIKSQKPVLVINKFTGSIGAQPPYTSFPISTANVKDAERLDESSASSFTESQDEFSEDLFVRDENKKSLNPNPIKVPEPVPANDNIKMPAISLFPKNNQNPPNPDGNPKAHSSSEHKRPFPVSNLPLKVPASSNFKSEKKRVTFDNKESEEFEIVAVSFESQPKSRIEEMKDVDLQLSQSYMNTQRLLYNAKLLSYPQVIAALKGKPFVTENFWVKKRCWNSFCGCFRSAEDLPQSMDQALLKLIELGLAAFDNNKQFDKDLIMSLYSRIQGRIEFQNTPQVWKELGFSNDKIKYNELSEKGILLTVVHFLFMYDYCPGILEKLTTNSLSRTPFVLLQAAQKLMKISFDLLRRKDLHQMILDAKGDGISTFLEFHSGLVLLWGDIYKKIDTIEESYSAIRSKAKSNPDLVLQMYRNEISGRSQ